MVAGGVSGDVFICYDSKQFFRAEVYAHSFTIPSPASLARPAGTRCGCHVACGVWPEGAARAGKTCRALTRHFGNASRVDLTTRDP